MSRLGSFLAAVGNFGKASKYFQQVVNLNPYDVENHRMLARVLEIQGRSDEAIPGLKETVGFMLRIGDKETAAKLQKYLELIESKKSMQKK